MFKPDLGKIKESDEVIIAINELVSQNETKEKQPTELNTAKILFNQLQEFCDNHIKELYDYKHAVNESSIVAITDQKGIIKMVNYNLGLPI